MTDTTPSNDESPWRDDLSAAWRTVGNLGAGMVLLAIGATLFLGLGYGMHLVFYPSGVFVPDWQIRLVTALAGSGVALLLFTAIAEEWTRDQSAPDAEEVDDAV